MIFCEYISWKYHSLKFDTQNVYINLFFMRNFFIFNILEVQKLLKYCKNLCSKSNGLFYAVFGSFVNWFTLIIKRCLLKIILFIKWIEVFNLIWLKNSIYNCALQNCLCIKHFYSITLGFQSKMVLFTSASYVTVLISSIIDYNRLIKQNEKLMTKLHYKFYIWFSLTSILVTRLENWRMQKYMRKKIEAENMEITFWALFFAFCIYYVHFSYKFFTHIWSLLKLNLWLNLTKYGREISDLFFMPENNVLMPTQTQRLTVEHVFFQHKFI